MNVKEEYKNGNIPNNETIYNSFNMTDYRLLNSNKVVCSVSGGSDSDLMIDQIVRVGGRDKTTFVFFDTGLESKATKEHLDFLEWKYDIVIKRIMAKKTIPLSCRDNGQPLISKQVSEYIERLQKHNFEWKDDSFENLVKKNIAKEQVKNLNLNLMRLETKLEVM